MSFGWNRPVRCEVGLVLEDGRSRWVDEHVGVLRAPGTPRRWLHAADVVGIPEGSSGGAAAEVLDLLPGCRVAVVLGEDPMVRVRGVPDPLGLPDKGTAAVVAALACSWPPEWGGPGAVAAAVRDAELSRVRCTGADPAVTVSVRLRGRTAVCRWEALR